MQPIKINTDRYNLVNNKNNAPSFGMAYIQEDVNRLVRRLGLKDATDFNKAAKLIHKKSEKAGYDFVVQRYPNPRYGLDNDVIMQIFNKSNGVQGNPSVLSFRQFADNFITYAKKFGAFFDEEAKRVKNLNRLF